MWDCQYQIVWVPKYRIRILEGKIANAVRSSTYANCTTSIIPQNGISMANDK
jgi:REP element-mobilizing transposase RayT